MLRRSRGRRTAPSRSFLGFVLIRMLPCVSLLLVALSVFFMIYSFQTLRKQEEQNTELLVDEKAEIFERYFAEIKSTLAYVASTSEVQTVLREYEDMNYLEKYHANLTVRGILGNLNIFRNYLEDVFVIGLNGYYTNLLSYSELRADCDPTQWESIRSYKPGVNTFFDYVLPYEIDCYVARPHKVFSVVFPVYVQGELLGYVQGNMDYDDVLEKFETRQHVPGMEIIVVNEEGLTVFSEDEASIGQPCSKDYLDYMTGNAGTFVYPGRQRELVVYRRSSLTNWYFLAATSYASLLAPGYTAARVLLLAVLPLTLLMMACVMYLMSRRIRQPIDRLLLRVEEADPERYSPVEAGRYGVLEVDLLGEHFEAAMQRIHDLIENVYQAQLRQRDAEFAALRDQITPHFMYNSLQLVKAEALLSGNREISQTVTSLANLLRYSMDLRAALVTLQEEVAYIQDYLDLYKKRYISKFDFTLALDPDTQAVQLPRLVLQPIVENCIRHGLSDTVSGGHISVQARIEGSDCLVEIWDNGCGMSPERLEAVRQSLQDTQRRGDSIGLANVHQRLRLLYGEGYGLTHIQSDDHGTSITLRLRGVGEREPQ